MDNDKKLEPTKVGKTWFLERGDGKILAMDELEAWNTLRNRSNWQRGDFKIYGVSDGTTYVKTLASANLEKQKLDEIIKTKSSDLTRYLGTLDRFKFELLLDDSDEKVVKVRGIISKLESEIEEHKKQFAKGYQDIVDKAFKAELKKAKGKIEMPQNQDIVTPHGSRDIILRNLPQR